MQPDTPAILRDDHGPVARLTLNRPQSRNALSRAMMAALSDALTVLAGQSQTRAVVLAAQGPVFCAGHDLKELRAHPEPSFQTEIFAQCSALMQQIQALPMPVIAQVQGLATAAGCQLVASCDLAVASSDARFATPGVNIGLFCSTPMVALTRAVPRKQAMEMLLTGTPIDAETARAYGLINRAVPADALAETVMQLAQSIAGKSRATVALGKEAFYRQAELPTAEAYDYASAVMAHNMGLADAGEGIDAFLEKRSPTWQQDR